MGRRRVRAPAVRVLAAPSILQTLGGSGSGGKSHLQIMAQPGPCPGEAKKSNTCAVSCAICRNGIFGNFKDI